MTDIGWTVLYPTAGLAVGRIMAPDWAVIACQAYNTWLYEKFLTKNPRLKGVALIPFQNLDAAIVELRRAVKELGDVGRHAAVQRRSDSRPLGQSVYWPLYEEAEKLDCCLAVHVGALHRVGMDAFRTYYPVHALGHPFSLMIQCAAMIGHGVFDRFTKLRVGFLEGGATWVPFMMDQLDRSYHDGHVQLDVEATARRSDHGEKASGLFSRPSCAKGQFLSASTATMTVSIPRSPKAAGKHFYWAAISP